MERTRLRDRISRLGAAGHRISAALVLAIVPSQWVESAAQGPARKRLATRAEAR